jgi:hypothetical protein
MAKKKKEPHAAGVLRNVISTATGRGGIGGQNADQSIEQKPKKKKKERFGPKPNFGTPFK